MTKGIVFDLDGTLWDSSLQVTAAWNTVLSIHNIKSITAEDMAGYMGKTIDEISGLVFPDLPKEQAMDVIYECCAKEQTYLSKHGGLLYPDLESTLQKMQQKHQLFIVSNCQIDYLNAFFTAHKLKRYFTDYECNGNTGLPKSENIQLIINRNNLDKAIYVGDTELDLESAHSAGIPFVFASYGFGSVKNAEYKIDCISDLLNMDF